MYGNTIKKDLNINNEIKMYFIKIYVSDGIYQGRMTHIYLS
jgi:hypothetical protein